MISNDNPDGAHRYPGLDVIQQFEFPQLPTTDSSITEAPDEIMVAYAALMGVFETAGCNPEKLEGRMILEKAAKRYAERYAAKSSRPSPRECFLEGAWDALTNGQYTINTDEAKNPPIFDESKNHTTILMTLSGISTGIRLKEQFCVVGASVVYRYAFETINFKEIGVRHCINGAPPPSLQEPAHVVWEKIIEIHPPEISSRPDLRTRRIKPSPVLGVTQDILSGLSHSYHPNTDINLYSSN